VILEHEPHLLVENILQNNPSIGDCEQKEQQQQEVFWFFKFWFWNFFWYSL